ncbi:MAG: dipeptide/oligopeptide/nickel ABC transporter ATP-binding protein [Desulfobacterales bacterium]|nr:dipeptide/oligopeptide/nickel ABC transporter ATP-binding protein [Desulfobacterales bacterium]
MLISVQNIQKSFAVGDSWFKKSRHEVLKGVSFELFEGECLGLLGESGSGKSTLGKVILGIEKPDSGEVVFADAISGLPTHEKMSVVFQDYTSSVNPRLRVEEIISEPLLRTQLTRTEKKQKVDELLVEVGLPESMKTRFPHQLSGGQLQRVCIARAIAPSPKFILLDEAVSSLDVSVQVQVLNLLANLKQRFDLSYLFITHDITVAAYLCNRILIFQDGKVVEQVDDLNNLAHATSNYANQLISAAHFLERAFTEPAV